MPTSKPCGATNPHGFFRWFAGLSCLSGVLIVDEELTQQIEDAIAAPISATINDKSATEQSIPDKIAGVTFVQGARALSGSSGRGGRKSGWNCLRPAKAVPPGAQ